MGMIKIDEIKYYARDFPDESEYGSPESSIIMQTKFGWWFDLKNEKLIHIAELVDKGICKNEDDTEGLAQLGYIEMARVNMVSLEKIFIDQFADENAKEWFAVIPDAGFDYAFRVFLEENDDLALEWGCYERYMLERATIKWCCDNHLNFIMR